MNLQAYINIPGHGPVSCAFESWERPLISDIKRHLCSPSSPLSDCYLTTPGGRPLSDNDQVFANGPTSFPVCFNLCVRVRGGKGGFGSMLRAQGGKMASQKTTNFESCRDLSGRRLKVVNDAKKLAEYLAKEPERKRKREEELIKKIDQGLRPEKRKILFHDPEYVSNHEQVLDDVMDAVEKAMNKAGPSGVKKASPVSKSPSPSADPKPVAALDHWDELPVDDSDEDSDDSDEGSEDENGDGVDNAPSSARSKAESSSSDSE
ncbi:telomere stability and silencing-domain-containing protein [Gaertneriomyces semiglobifer]|nr:telomere stability and silencing-domain-containing protein [Gaertneriomyces semiglobifer]